MSKKKISINELGNIVLEALKSRDEWKVGKKKARAQRQGRSTVGAAEAHRMGKLAAQSFAASQKIGTLGGSSRYIQVGREQVRQGQDAKRGTLKRTSPSTVYGKKKSNEEFYNRIGNIMLEAFKSSRQHGSDIADKKGAAEGHKAGQRRIKRYDKRRDLLKKDFAKKLNKKSNLKEGSALPKYEDDYPRGYHDYSDERKALAKKIMSLPKEGQARKAARATVAKYHGRQVTSPTRLQRTKDLKSLRSSEPKAPRMAKAAARRLRREPLNKKSNQ